MSPPSLYIHIPFCSRKCLFCSFVISVGQEHRREEYVNALVMEMQRYGPGALKTIYFGGGTPSMLDEKHFAVLMDAVEKKFIFQRGMEITIEVNPESIDRAKAVYLRQRGFNRISLGVQSLDDRYLKFLGRPHDSAMALAAYRILREAGFSNINLDLMYGFPGQTDEELEKDVRAIAVMGSEHLSIYTLTVEPNSRFYATQMKLDDNEKQAGHYLMIARILKGYGVDQYEVSNFSREGFQSLHNKNYWRGVPYIGLGVGAHGFTGHRRYWNTSNLTDYIKKAGSGEEAGGFEDLTGDQLVMERVLFGLRMNEGIPWGSIPSAKEGLIRTWIGDGFLWQDGQQVMVTDRGRLVLDELSARLI